MILTQANELARGILATAYAFHGEADPAVQIQQTTEGFVLITPDTPEDAAQRVAALIDNAPKEGD